MHDTIVVGAGIAGLAYAHARGPDADLLLLEGSERPGGLVQTLHHGDVHVEQGPEALQDNAPETMALLDELGLSWAPADPAAARRCILTEDGPVDVPTGPGAFVRSPLLSLGAKLRAFTGVFRAGDGALDGSIADFVRQVLGEQVLARLVDPAISGIYAGDAEQLSLEAAFPTLHALVAEHGSIMKGMKAKARARKERGEPRPPTPSLLAVKGGLERIPEAIGAFLGERLVTGCPVSEVRREADGAWTVHADGRSWQAHRVVLGVPARHASAALAQASPPLSQELGSMVSENVVSVAHLWKRSDVAGRVDAFGYLVPSSMERSHLGTLFSSSIHPDRCPPDADGNERVLMRTLIGGARHPELADLDDAALVELVMTDVAPILGLAGRPLWTDVARWRAALPRYDLDQPGRQGRIDALLADLPGLFLVGNHRRGISVNALIESSRELAHQHGEPAGAVRDRDSEQGGVVGAHA